MNLNDLRPNENSRKTRKRIGRGHGSGWGKTAGKGHNGQKQRSGASVSSAFEGGQMPIMRRVPKRGFSNSAFKKDMIVLNIRDIAEKLEDGSEVSLQTLSDNGVVKNISCIKKYSDKTLRGLKGKKRTKEYLMENIESGVKEKDFKSLLKIIGNEPLSKKFTVKTHKISKSAKEVIENAGGTVEIITIRTYSNIAGNNEKNKEAK